MKETALIILGIAWGDEGKGHITNAYTQKYNANWNIRFSGGCQAAHNVINNGVHHTFSQFGSGSLNPCVKTYLSEDMLVEPLALLLEAEELGKKTPRPLNRVYINENALITTPFHAELNRLKENIRGDKKHGSCGKGIWETVNAASKGFFIQAKDIFSSDRLALKNKLQILKDYLYKIGKDLDSNFNIDTLPLEDILDIYYFIGHSCEAHIVREGEEKNLLKGSLVFEGSQGILLDCHYGFAPYYTATDVTAKNAIKILNRIDWEDTSEIVGVTRTYAHRHGAGPLPTEIASNNEKVIEPHNKYNKWQGEFRVGYLDIPLIQYALSVQSVDTLAVTHCDTILPEVCRSYYINNVILNPALLKDIEEHKRTDILNAVTPHFYPENSFQSLESINAPIKIKSFGPSNENIVFI